MKLRIYLYIPICLYLYICISFNISISLYVYISLCLYISSFYISKNHLKYPWWIGDTKVNVLNWLKKWKLNFRTMFFNEILVPNSRREIYQKFIEMHVERHYDVEIKIQLVKTLHLFVDYHLFLQHCCA